MTKTPHNEKLLAGCDTQPVKRLHLKEAVEPHNVWSIIKQKKKITLFLKISQQISRYYVVLIKL